MFELIEKSLSLYSTYIQDRPSVNYKPQSGSNLIGRKFIKIDAVTFEYHFKYPIINKIIKMCYGILFAYNIQKEKLWG